MALITSCENGRARSLPFRTVTKAGVSPRWRWFRGACSPQVCNNHFRLTPAPLVQPGMYGSCSERGENYHCVGKLVLHFCFMLLTQPHTCSGYTIGSHFNHLFSLRIYGLGRTLGISRKREERIVGVVLLSKNLNVLRNQTQSFWWTCQLRTDCFDDFEPLF